MATLTDFIVWLLPARATPRSIAASPNEEAAFEHSIFDKSRRDSGTT
ncbi:MAG TPA: hypothetical protein VIT18_04170 [Terrimicrobiaceae bacterium]